MPSLAFFRIVILLSGFVTPKFTSDLFSHLGSMTSSLTMMVIGSVINIMDFQEFKLSKEILAASVFRLVLAPSTAYKIGTTFSTPAKMIKTTTLIVFLPTPNTTVILTKKYNTDVLLATEPLSFSVSVCLIFLPVILMFIHSI